MLWSLGGGGIPLGLGVQELSVGRSWWGLRWVSVLFCGGSGGAVLRDVGDCGICRGKGGGVFSSGKTMGSG